MWTIVGFVAVQSIYQSLDSLLNYEGNVEDDIMAVFSVGFCGMFDVNGNHELKPNGENIPVTNDNRQVRF